MNHRRCFSPLLMPLLLLHLVKMGWQQSKKNHVVCMIAVVAICFLLGTITVIHEGSSGSNNYAPDDNTMLNKDIMLIGVQE